MLKHRRKAVWAAWIGGVLLGLIVAFLLLLTVSDWNFARSTVAHYVSGKLHREVRLDGNLTAHLLSKQPKVRIESIVVGNPDWVGESELATVESIEFSLGLRDLLHGDLAFETLVVNQPKVSLIGDKDGRANYYFGSKDGSVESKGRDEGELPSWPAVRTFTLNGGELYVRDELHKLTFRGRVEATEKSDQEEAQFKLAGDGDLNGESFEAKFSGAPLVNLRIKEPYAFNADVTAGKTHVTARGRFGKPFDVATVATAIEASGDNLAHLYYLTGIALPFTPPYKVAGDLINSKQLISVDNLKGTVGKSDISGKLAVNLAEDRPKLTAELRSASLDLADLAPSIGKGIRTDAKDGSALDSKAPEKMPANKLFPTYEFEFDRLRTTNADVTLYADSIRTQAVPFKEVNLHLKLNDSVLQVDPIVFTLPQGKISAKVRVDAREKIAKDQLDIRIHDVKLDQFKGKDAKESPLDGTLQARMQITGAGNSVHELASTANGKLNVVVPHGEVRKAFAELVGINIAKGLGLLLAKDQSRMNVRCGIATVDIKDGAADVDQMVFDTETVLIKGDGTIELAPEKLDLDIAGHPKKFQLVRVRAPVTVNGTLRKPAIGIDAGDAAKQVGIAALIGALATPLAAALAFVDPGLAKDANCAALLADAQKMAASGEPVLHPANSSVRIPAQTPNIPRSKF